MQSLCVARRQEALLHTHVCAACRSAGLRAAPRATSVCSSTWRMPAEGVLTCCLLTTINLDLQALAGCPQPAGQAAAPTLAWPGASPQI